MALSDADFERIVADTIVRLPATFRAHLDNVLISIADWPTAQMLADAEVQHPEELFGIYEGVPLTERGSDPELQPACVHIYRESLRAAHGATATELEAELRHTVLHEIGHHFGLTDEQMEALGVY